MWSNSHFKENIWSHITGSNRQSNSESKYTDQTRTHYLIENSKWGSRNLRTLWNKCFDKKAKQRHISLSSEVVLTAIWWSKLFYHKGKNGIIRGDKLSQGWQTGYRQIHRVKEYCLNTMVINSGLSVAISPDLQWQGYSCRWTATSLQ